jgi:Cu/Ag efflux protein CusF/translation initiation factor IF-1
VKTTASSLFAAMLLAAAAAHGGGETPTQQATSAQPSMQRETLDEISATVVSVDPNTRIIQLRGDDGRTGAFTAGPEVKNFAQIRTGDKVVVSYYRGIAAQVLPPGAAASKEVNQLDLAAAAQPGAKPSAGVGSAIRGTVVVQKTDTKANTITVLKPDGDSRTIPIESDEGKAFIKKLKKGDKVDVVYAEALAVEVRPQS